MTKIFLKGNEINTVGSLPAVSQVAPKFSLTNTDLAEVSLDDYKGKRIILNIFPSLDTSVCATSVRKFNSEVEKLDNTVVLCISKDLPFAHKRFCVAEGLNNVISLSELRDNNFGKDYGVLIIDGPLKGLFSRAIVVIDENQQVVYVEQVNEITTEPDYEKAKQALV